MIENSSDAFLTSRGAAEPDLGRSRLPRSRGLRRRRACRWRNDLVEFRLDISKKDLKILSELPRR